MVMESPEWRDWLFEHRAPEVTSPYPNWARKFGQIVNQGIIPGMMGGQGGLALNQLLVVMDGIDNPPFFRRVVTNKTNSLLDAVYVVPRRLNRLGGKVVAALLGVLGLALFVDAILLNVGAVDPTAFSKMSLTILEPILGLACFGLSYLPVAADREGGDGLDATAAREGERVADLLHRRDERPARDARPGAHPPGPDGASRELPDSHQGRPDGHLRPLPRRRWPTTPISTGPSGATRSHGSRAATHRP